MNMSSVIMMKIQLLAGAVKLYVKKEALKQRGMLVRVQTAPTIVCSDVLHLYSKRVL